MLLGGGEPDVQEGGQIFLMRAFQYDFTTAGGDHLRGTKIIYTDAAPSGQKGVQGWDMFEDSIPYEAMNDVRAVPGIYNTKEQRQMGKDKKPVVRIIGLKFTHHVEFSLTPFEQAMPVGAGKNSNKEG